MTPSCAPASSRTSWRSGCRRPCRTSCDSAMRTPPRAGSTASITTSPARSASSSWRRDGWPSAACGSSRSSTATAPPAPGTRIPGSAPITRPCAPGRPADRRTAGRPQAPRAAGRHDRRLGDRVRPDPVRQGSDGRDHHNYGFSIWMAGGGIEGASSTAPPMSWASTPSKTGITSPTSTPRSCTSSASTPAASRSPDASGWRSNTAGRSGRSWLSVAICGMDVSIPDDAAGRSDPSSTQGEPP